MKLSVNRLMAALVVELIEGEVPQPLYQEFTLGAIWADLCRLAGEPVPPAVAAIADLPVALCPAATDTVMLHEPYRVAEFDPA